MPAPELVVLHEEALREFDERARVFLVQPIGDLEGDDKLGDRCETTVGLSRCVVPRNEVVGQVVVVDPGLVGLEVVSDALVEQCDRVANAVCDDRIDEVDEGKVGVFKVVVVIVGRRDFAWLQWPSRRAVGAVMCAGDVNEGEMKIGI